MKNLFTLSLKLKGFPLAEAQKHFQSIVNISESEYSNYIGTQQQNIVNYHKQHNGFYRGIVADVNTAYWEDIPVLGKKDLQQPLENRLSEGYTVKNIFKSKTSGSSGDPFVFAKDKYCHALTWASIIYRYAMYGIDLDSAYQARFYGIPLDFVGYQKERFKDFLSHRYRFSIFNLSDKVLAEILEKFRSKKFDYINGYTSSVVLFAKFLERQNIILTQICPTLKVCMVTSEMLFAEDKLLLEKQFGVPTVNEYGASELDLIAFQNPSDEWQVNSETLYVEVLDDQNKPVPYGTEGRIVITSLYNQAHPFIRYDIGDIGILSVASTPKKPILEKLIGRTNDVALLPSGKKSPGLTFYYVTKSIIEDDGNVKEFIIKQTQLNRFEIEYVSETELSNTQIQTIQKAIDLYLEPGLQFSFTRKTVLNRSKRGKLKQFESLVK